MKALNKTIYILPVMAALLGVACESVSDEPQAGPMPLVVEGWIEEGAAPVVMVTRAVDLSDELASFDDVVERWARVSVSDGERRYYLSGRIDTNYTPPFIFTTSRLKGKVGHSYSLLVETETDSVEAESRLMPAPLVARLEAEPIEGSDSLYRVRAWFDGIEPDGMYRVFVRSQRQDSRFFGAFMGTFSGADYDPSEGRIVTRGVHSLYDAEGEFSHYFPYGDRVSVKICSMEAELYDFWRVYDSSVSLSQNLFFSFAENCPSNVRGGLGYWAAYGMDYRSINIR